MAALTFLKLYPSHSHPLLCFFLHSYSPRLLYDSSTTITHTRCLISVDVARLLLLLIGLLPVPQPPHPLPPARPPPRTILLATELLEPARACPRFPTTTSPTPLLVTDHSATNSKTIYPTSSNRTSDSLIGPPVSPPPPIFLHTTSHSTATTPRLASAISCPLHVLSPPNLQQ
jgi:hypothetical protein